jgi:outer membrane murein-binding lipoprotein Lpp
MLFAAAVIGSLVLAVTISGTRDSLIDQAAAQVRGKPSAAATTDVDVELVIAVDVSYSMDPDEQALQREGYITGLTSPEFLNALQQGAHGKVALTYFEWAGAADQKIVVPWRLIDGPAAARAFADAIAAAPYRRAYRTSISGALHFALPLFEGSGFRGLRRVIDVSGDGVNNQGDVVTIVRDMVLERGITINGLPILLKPPSLATMDIEDLDIYYEDCVIGGPGAFVIPIRKRDQFRDATRTKLVQEIASRDVAPRVIPAAADKPRISCTIGERMWQQRWGGMDFR